MDKLYVDLAQNSYDILFSDSFSGLSDAVKGITKSRKLLIVTDSNVDKLYRNEVVTLLKNSGFEVSYHSFEAGEENKNIDTICGICKACLDNRLDRNSLIVALGGGVVGDMAGFAASIYMRGIDFIQVPTTLLSQSDSSVGGKTGIDFCGGKNILGAFHQPKLVYINVSVLKTLPEREFISGMGEVIKHGIIADKDFFDYLYVNSDSVKSLECDVLLKMCKTNCSIKAGVVSQDEKENGLRAILNFGHTIGHAIETYYDFKLTHGECVGLGICAVASIAEERKMISGEEALKIIEILKMYGFNTNIKLKDTKKIIEIMYMDKKVRDGKLKFVLPCGIGSVKIVNDVTEEEILKSLDVLNG